MYMFENGGVMVESVDELPLEFIGADDIFIDFETSSGDPKIKSVNPHHNCSIAGIAFGIADSEYVYYIHYTNFSDSDKSYICDYFYNLVEKSKRWINHNVKYDAHVSCNYMGFKTEVPQLVDTLTLAKLIDSDRMTHGGYGLDALALAWCGLDMSKYEARLQPYLGDHNKDYGAIPADILGEYACEDVFAEKALFKYIWDNIPEQCWEVRDTEIELTRNLFEMEQTGMCIDTNEIMIKQYKVLNRMIQIDAELTELVGWHFNPKSGNDCYHLFINQLGLPILKFTLDDNGESTGNPSFDKHVMKMYENHPLAPKNIIKLVQEYRNLMQLNSLFLEPFQVECIRRHGTSIAILCATYNQCVRTGRMSCSDPNMQQNSSESKKLIHPPEGCKFISIDYSQIELRTIVHYIDDKRSIQMWNENPDMDFHQFTADDIGVERDPAKTLNFGMGFGEGKAKLTKQLATDPSLVGGFLKQIDAMIEAGEIPATQRAARFGRLAQEKAEAVYNGYHRRYPTMKSEAKNVERALLKRGFVFNLAGRRRHLDRRFAYRAFNTVNQSSAADIMKNRANAVCRMLKGTPIKLVAIVHDEFLFTCPNEYADMFETHRDLVHVLESNPFPMSVPIRCSLGTSAENWSKAGKSVAKGGNCAPVIYDRNVFTNLDHTRAHVS